MIEILRKTVFSERAESRGLLFLLAAFIVILLPGSSAGGELTARFSAELWTFPNKTEQQGQERHNESLAIQPEYYHQFDGGSSFTIIPFYRYDRMDPERTHFDIREMNYQLILDSFEFRIGAGKVFWGATEFVHLVDIINQTDLVENLDGEDKLGQPMLQFVIPLDWGALDFFILPYFRERTFPGKDGRFRSSIPVDTDSARYEDPDEEYHVDLAARLSGTAGILDFGFSYFRGTGREPTLLPGIAPDGSSILIPLYEQIEQGSVDLQAVAGAWLLKLEALRRSGQGEAFYSYSSGVEYTFVGVWGSRLDLGVITEYAYDSRGAKAASGFQKDIMLGFRLAVNDFSSTELLLGYAYDMDYDSQVVRAEGSRRVGNNARLSLEAGLFLDMDPADVLYDLRNDDYLAVMFSYYL